MKLTALIPDDLIEDVKRHAGGETLTECVVLALREWVSMTRLKDLNRTVEAKPIKFRQGFSATEVRSASRRKRS